MTTPAAVPGEGRAASALQRVLAQARFETLAVLRNGEQLLVSVVLPSMVLLGLALTSVPPLGEGRRIDIAVPGVLALCILSSAFTGQAIATGFDRRYGVLRLLGSTPLGRRGLLGAKALAVLVVVLLQFAAVGCLGLVLGWEPRWGGIPAAAVTTLLGTWSFVALALLLGGTLRAEGVLALANLVWVALLALGGVVVPVERLPAALRTVASLLPSGALGEGMRSALVSGQADRTAWLVLLVWAAAATGLASRFFRWSD